MSAKVNVDGVVHDAAEAVVPATDHGFLFGDSIYETLRAYGGRIFRWSAHWERLGASAATMELDLPVDEAELRRRVEGTIEVSGEREAAIRVVVTRGVGPMDIDPAGCVRPGLLVYVRARPTFPQGAYRDGVPLCIVTRRRNSRLSLDPNVKSGNYLNNVLALVEARKTGAWEAVMLNGEGHVTECSTSNVFLVKDGRVATPSLASGLLSGITRRTVVELCGTEGLPCEERIVRPEELRSADEVFITSSLKQVMPVSSVDGEAVASGGAGEVTLRLLEGYRRLVEAETGVAPEGQ